MSDRGAHSPRFLDVTVYVCMCGVLTKSWKSWNFQISEIRLEDVEACAGPHIRSGRAPRSPGASAKHSAASQHVIPPDHRDIVSVVCQICIFQWNSMKIIENSMKINDLVGSEPIQLKCRVSTLTLSRPLGAFLNPRAEKSCSEKEMRFCDRSQLFLITRSLSINYTSL